MPGKRWWLIAVLVALVAAVMLLVKEAPSCRTEATSAAELGLILLDDSEGAVVLAVRDRSTAERAGILPGDVLRHADNTPLRTAVEMEAMMQAPGAQALRVKVLRTERLLEINIPLFIGVH